MFGVALLTSALLALADARLYERCELARDLVSLGIRKEHLATWVCIAFHESRFDTAARNPYSGDHGLLQISELYWCGAGKACGLPCSALRDEDITDDVECALRVHEEHTRLQGNGFLAWVVYPQHCKHNAKKYLADCESSVKTPLVRTDGRARVLKAQNRNVTTFTYNSKIDELLPPYLTVGSFLRGAYEKEFEQNYKNKVKVNWLNYKIDNIDDLKLPVFNQKISGEYTTFASTYPIISQKVTAGYKSTTLAPTSSTTLSPLPNIKPPSPRRIESNSFRRRKMRPTSEPFKLSVTTPSPMTTSTILFTTVAPRNKHNSTTENIWIQDSSLQYAATTMVPVITTTTTTVRTSTKDVELSSPFASSSTSISALKTSQTMKPLIAYTTNSIGLSTVVQHLPTKIKDKSPSIMSATKDQNSTTNQLVNHSLLIDKTSLIKKSFSDLKRNFSLNKTHNYVVGEHVSTSGTSSKAPYVTSKNSFNIERHALQSTTSRPWSNSWLTWRTTPSYKTIITSTTSKPSSISWRTAKSWSRTEGQKNENNSTTASQNQPTTSNPWAKTRGWPETKSTELSRSNNVYSTKQKAYFTTPTASTRLTVSSSTKGPKSTTTTRTSTEIPSPTIARTTQSIFDLYLNPTKRPITPAFSIPFFKNRGLSFKIFAGGTTTHAPSFLKSEESNSALKGTAIKTN